MLVKNMTSKYDIWYCDVITLEEFSVPNSRTSVLSIVGVFYKAHIARELSIILEVIQSRVVKEKCVLPNVLSLMISL